MKKVLLGMSGGVDSSVSAVLLKEAGYDVIGATMILCGNDEPTFVQDAKKVCEKLGIPHYVIDGRCEFKKKVVDSFVDSYINAHTPNPCIECNQFIKFDLFYKKAIELDCDYIATGHYAKTEYSSEFNRTVLVKSKADKKDQTYFLYRVSPNILNNVLFPLSDFETKEQIRDLAEKYDLEVSKKPDSQEVCFIPDNDYASFVQKSSEQTFKRGKMVTKSGEILGEHKGLIHYTIGQRKGLGVSYKEPLYVIRLDKTKNEVVVGTEDKLYTNILYANELNYLIPELQGKVINVQAKVRYRSQPANARVIPCENGEVKVVFDIPQRAITPGQSVVFYKENVVIGGGKIIR